MHHKFTGQELDDSTGFYFYGARYYDAVLGRFISADTVVQSLRNPQSLNRYSYTVNNPLRLIDPTGNYYEDYSYLNDSYYDYSYDYNYDYSNYSYDYSGDYYSGSSYSSTASSLSDSSLESSLSYNSITQSSSFLTSGSVMSALSTADLSSITAMGANNNKPAILLDEQLGQTYVPSSIPIVDLLDFSNSNPVSLNALADTFSADFWSRLTTTNHFFFSYPTGLTRTLIGLGTAGSVAESFGTVTPLNALMSLPGGGVPSLGITGTVISAGVTIVLTEPTIK